jgi:hypothetical protein
MATDQRFVWRINSEAAIKMLLINGIDELEWTMELERSSTWYLVMS